ncbi:glycosyltransferase [Candidatus Woesearchaeota archaeon]|nr:glycosyltransferase [Candidatus Woesearchaeota archaeon]
MLRIPIWKLVENSGIAEWWGRLKMRIAMFTDLFWPINNGVATSIMNSSRWLAKNGHKVMIFASHSDNAPASLGRNISIFYCKPMRNLKLINYKDFSLARPGLGVFRKIREFKPDVIHVHSPSPIGWAALVCSKLYGIPVVGTYHGFLQDFLEHAALPRRITKSEFAKKVAWSYTRNYFNRCDLIIAPSAAAKAEFVRNGFMRYKIRVVSNGIDLRNFHPRKARRKGNVILHVGRLSYEKRIEVVIRAFSIVAKKDKKAVLVIIGSGPQEGWLRRMAGSLLGSRIKFLGFVEHKRLADYYSSCDVFVTASTIETEGLVILEAMACGLPVVGVNVRAVPEIVRNGVNGFIAEAGNAPQIAGYLERLLKNPGERKRLGRNSLGIARGFSLNKTAKLLEKAYTEMTSKKKRIQ